MFEPLGCRETRTEPFGPRAARAIARAATWVHLLTHHHPPPGSALAPVDRQFSLLAPNPPPPGGELTFAMQRAVPSNIGHTVWEEQIPFFAALGDVGFEGRQRNFSQLLFDPVPYPGQQLYGGFFTKDLLRAVAPGGGECEGRAKRAPD